MREHLDALRTCGVVRIGDGPHGDHVRVQAAASGQVVAAYVTAEGATTIEQIHAWPTHPGELIDIYDEVTDAQCA